MSDPIYQQVLRDSLVDAMKEAFHLFGIHIDGVEVTQAIQYRSAELHLTDLSDRGPDNSIRLVADKPAMVRVYVRSFPATAYGVVGSVMLQWKRYGVWVDVEPLLQRGGPSVVAEADPGYAAERGNLSSSLNFIIPAARMRGTLRLKVQVRMPGDERVAEEVVDIGAHLMQTIKMRGIPVQYFGPDAAGNAVRLAAPTMAEFQATIATTLRMYPVSQTPDISLAGTMTWSEPLTGAIVNGQCPTSWNDILYWLGWAHVIDGNRSDSLYYALLPVGIPIGGAAGCGGPGAGGGSGVSGDGLTMRTS